MVDRPPQVTGWTERAYQCALASGGRDNAQALAQNHADGLVTVLDNGEAVMIAEAWEEAGEVRVMIHAAHGKFKRLIAWFLAFIEQQGAAQLEYVSQSASRARLFRRYVRHHNRSGGTWAEVQAKESTPPPTIRSRWRLPIPATASPTT